MYFILFSDIFDCQIEEPNVVVSESSTVQDVPIVESTKVEDNTFDYSQIDADTNVIREIITEDKDFDLFLEKDAELNYTTDTYLSENKEVDSELLETTSKISDKDVFDEVTPDKNSIHVASTGEKTYVTDTGKHFPIKKQSALSKTISPSPKKVKRLKKRSPSVECASISPPIESQKLKSVVKRIYNKIADNNMTAKGTYDDSPEKISRRLNLNLHRDHRRYQTNEIKDLTLHINVNHHHLILDIIDRFLQKKLMRIKRIDIRHIMKTIVINNNINSSSALK